MRARARASAHCTLHSAPASRELGPGVPDQAAACASAQRAHALATVLPDGLAHALPPCCPMALRPQRARLAVPLADAMAPEALQHKPSSIMATGGLSHKDWARVVLVAGIGTILEWVSASFDGVN